MSTVAPLLPDGRRIGAGALRALAVAGGGALLALVVAYELWKNPISLTLALAGGIGLIAVLALALASYRAAVALGLILLAIVKFEPAPTDAVFLVAIAVAIATGTFAIDRVPLVVAALIGVYLTINIAALTEVQDFHLALRFSFTTFYLALFGLWLASWVTSRDRARLVVRAYVFSAVVSAALGALAVVAPIPGKSSLLEYGNTRAVGLFKDPNVFGAFLVPAALIVLDEALAPRLLRGRRATRAAMFLVLTIGVVFSFSRAAWLNLALGVATMIGVLALRRGGGRSATRLVTVVVVAVAAVAVALVASGSVAFLQQRAHLQGYDTQRFGAQAEGLRLVASHPFGVGPGQFELYSIVSAHSTYVRAMAELGVLGIATVAALILATLVLGLRNAVLGRETYGIGSAPLLGAWCGLVLSGFVIDTLHWRHLWLVAALIWAGAAQRPSRAAGRF